jgi:tetratricopeptide (TPR) repeat protein/class 3 adenylate cyclase
MDKPNDFLSPIGTVRTVTLGSDGIADSRPLTADTDVAAVLADGEILQGVFKIECFIASGGMGQVFQARDLRLERAVAVKVLHGRFQMAEGLKRFQKEARSLSRVVHPNVVATYEVGFHDGRPFLVMEYVDGPTLGSHVRATGGLDVADAVRLTTQIGAGLEEAHALGIVHRDVKPGNILLHRLRAGGLLAKVVDFGLAIALEGNTAADGKSVVQKHDIAGSPLYMSPEQIRGEELTGASDQYSLAVVLFEMLAGRPPFVGDSLKAIFDKHLNSAVPEIHLSTTLETAERINAVVRKGMAKHRAERYLSIAEFVSALKEAIGGGEQVDRASTACDVCGTRNHSDDGFCRGCGTPVPMKSCQVCGAARVGKRYHCIQCFSSLLVRPGHRRAVEAKSTGLAAAEEENITTYGVMVCLEASAEHGVIDDWKWMVEQFRTSVEREHGHTVAILGNEVLAYFGMGGLREREVECAVDASLYALDLISRHLESVSRTDDVNVRIGVELGELDAADTGMSWGTACMTGPCVQSVRGLVRNAQQTGVYVGPNVWREIRSLYESTDQQNIRRVMSRRRVAILREASNIAGQSVPFVGRNYEVEHLERAFRRVVTHGRLVTVPVIGPAGIGKSRLLSEFLTLLNQRSERCEVDVSHCIPSGEGVPFAPFRSSFRSRYRLFGEEDERTIRGVLRHLPGVRKLPERVSAQRVHHLESLLGFGSTSQDKLVKEQWVVSADRTQELAFDAYCEYVRAMAGDVPYVLALDDLQWMRPSSAKLLSYIAAHCEDRPILIILTVRQKDASQLLSNLNLNIASVSSVELGPLSKRDVGLLATELFGENVLDSELLGTLHDLSNGLPQELEGHLEALVDGGLLQKTDSGWRYEPKSESKSSALPQSLRELVQQRLVRLGPEEQRILRAAALAGPSFSVELLSAMVDRVVDARELDVLVRTGWLLESNAGDFPRSRELSFRQDGIRESILHMLSEEASHQLHERAVNWLSREESSIDPSARSGRLAKHYSATGNYREAARYTLHKAREFEAVFAAEEAYTAYGEVMQLLSPRLSGAASALVLDWYVESGLGRAHHAWVLGENDEAAMALQKLNSVTNQVTRPLAWCRQQYLFGELAYIEGRYGDAVDQLKAAADFALGSGLTGTAAQLQGRLIFALAERGSPDEAVQLAHRLLVTESPEVLSDPLWNRGAGSATGFLARMAVFEKNYAEARDYYLKSMEYRRGANDPVGVWMAKMGEGTVFFFAEQWAEAESAYAEATRELHNLGYRVGAAQGQVNWAEAMLALKQPSRALELLAEPESTLRAVKSVGSLVELLRCRSIAQRDLGHLSEAQNSIDNALNLAKEHGLEHAIPPLEALAESLTK